MARPIVLGIINESTIEKTVVNTITRFGQIHFDVKFVYNETDAIVLVDKLFNARQNIAFVISDQILFNQSTSSILQHLAKKIPNLQVMYFYFSENINPTELPNSFTYYFCPSNSTELVIEQKIQTCITNYVNSKYALKIESILKNLNKVFYEIDSLSDTKEIRLAGLQQITQYFHAQDVYYISAENGQLLVSDFYDCNEKTYEQMKIHSTEQFEEFNSQVKNSLTEALQLSKYPRAELVIPIYKKGVITSYLYIKSDRDKPPYELAHYYAMQIFAYFIEMKVDYEKRQIDNNVYSETDITPLKEDPCIDRNQLYQYTIKFAKTIQNFILPSKDTLAEAFPRSFLFFRTQNSISNCFYFFVERYYKFWIIMADSSINGIPTTFMSLISKNLLYDITYENATIEPNKVLQIFNQKYSEIFQSQNSSKEQAPIFLNISLCSIDMANMVLEFSGANKNIFIERDQHIDVLQGEKQPIESGNSKKNQSYSLIKYNLEKDDSIFFFSDGFNYRLANEDNQQINTPTKFLENMLKLSLEEKQKDINRLIDSWNSTDEMENDIIAIGINIHPENE